MKTLLWNWRTNFAVSINHFYRDILKCAGKYGNGNTTIDGEDIKQHVCFPTHWTSDSKYPNISVFLCTSPVSPLLKIDSTKFGSSAANPSQQPLSSFNQGVERQVCWYHTVVATCTCQSQGLAGFGWIIVTIIYRNCYRIKALPAWLNQGPAVRGEGVHAWHTQAVLSWSCTVSAYCCQDWSTWMQYQTSHARFQNLPLNTSCWSIDVFVTCAAKNLKFQMRQLKRLSGAWLTDELK